jgi:hypothetical protein
MMMLEYGGAGASGFDGSGGRGGGRGKGKDSSVPMTPESFEARTPDLGGGEGSPPEEDEQQNEEGAAQQQQQQPSSQAGPAASQPAYRPLVVLACRHIYHQSCLEALQPRDEVTGARRHVDEYGREREYRCPIDG